MAKLIYVCRRHGAFGPEAEARLLGIGNALLPDNIASRNPEACVQGDVAWAVSQAGAVTRSPGGSVLLGYLYGDDAGWSEVGSAPPDGSYALIRNDPDRLEAITDPAGSRTVWYLLTDDLFIVSTSQRAIVMMAGSVDFNDRVIPWMLSTGSLGPELSWDRRVRRLQPASSVALDKRAWTVSERVHVPVAFEPEDRSVREHEDAIRSALERTTAALARLDWGQWVLPLSGGYDSRGILCLIRTQLGLPEGFRTVTWGLASSRTQKGNDALIAAQLADALGVRNDYLLTELSTEPAEAIANRFVFCAEGRTDHVAGYADGLDIWRRLHAEGMRGIIRGDEGFGWVEVTSELGTRLSVEGGLCSDFENLKHVPALLGQEEHRHPDFLVRQEGETLESWRDRLYHAYRIPTVLAALSDIKLAYVEQITPLLSRDILQAVRRLPDRLRTEKSLYKSVVSALGPAVPYASRGANADPRDLVESPQFSDLVRAELSDTAAQNTLGAELVRQILNGMTATDSDRRRSSRMRKLKGAIAQRLPRFAKDLMRATVVKPTVGGNTLAFRAYIIARMRRLLEEDSKRFPAGG